MSFTESVTICLTKKYADFNGRASRSEYWWFFALYFGAVAILYILAWITFTASIAANPYNPSPGFSSLLFVLAFLVFLAGIIPFLAAGARRLHDTGKTALLLLLYLVPGGSIALIVLCALEPNRGPNLYGPDPLDPTGQATGMPNPYAQPYGAQPYGSAQPQPYGSAQPYAQPQAQQFGGAPTAQPAGNPYAQPYGSAPTGAQPTSGPYTTPASNQPSARPTGNPYAAPASQPSPAATDQSGQDQTGFTAPEGDAGGSGGTGNGTV